MIYVNEYRRLILRHDDDQLESARCKPIAEGFVSLENAIVAYLNKTPAGADCSDVILYLGLDDSEANLKRIRVRLSTMATRGKLRRIQRGFYTTPDNV